jgi:hypothetical protein
VSFNLRGFFRTSPTFHSSILFFHPIHLIHPFIHSIHINHPSNLRHHQRLLQVSVASSSSIHEFIVHLTLFLHGVGVGVYPPISSLILFLPSIPSNSFICPHSIFPRLHPSVCPSIRMFTCPLYPSVHPFVRPFNSHFCFFYFNLCLTSIRVSIRAISAWVVIASIITHLSFNLFFVIRPPVSRTSIHSSIHLISSIWCIGRSIFLHIIVHSDLRARYAF